MTTLKPRIMLELLSWIDSLPGEVVYRKITPSQVASTTNWPNLSDVLSVALKKMGHTSPYVFQREAVLAALAGQNVVVENALPHQKSMGYDVAVLDTFVKKPASSALYISPLAAIDTHRFENLKQIAKTAGMEIAFRSLGASDPASLFDKAPQEGVIVLCDMETLHSSLLPNHVVWEDFFSNLRYIVLDEIHLYRGIVGSHATNIIRRLRRICRHYNNAPVFLCKTPPLIGTHSFAERLIGEKVTMIVDESSPLSEHHTIVYNAELLDPRLNIRRVPLLETALIAGEALANDIGTVVFAHSKSNVEALTSGIALNLANRGHKSGLVIPYLGNENAEQLKAIQQSLDEEDIRGVITQNSLNLNVDLHALDISILHGVPDSLATALQQMQVVRDTKEVSVGLLVASASPMDQFLTAYPSSFMETPKERVVLNPDNPHIIANHIACAHKELPFSSLEPFGSFSVPLEHPYLSSSGKKDFSLSTATSRFFAVMDVTNKEDRKVITYMDRASAPSFLYPQSTFIFDGQMYEVEDLNYEINYCFVKKVSGDFYTRSYRIAHIKELQQLKRGRRSHLSKILLSLQLRSYRKVKTLTGENIGYGYIALPDEQMETYACELTLANQSRWYEWEEDRQSAALNGLAHLVNGVLPLFLMNRRHEVLVLGKVRQVSRPCVYVVDNVPGGMGYADAACELDEQILESALKGLQGCRCQTGCLACVGHSRPVLLIKEAVTCLLSELLQLDSEVCDKIPSGKVMEHGKD